jgi:hypothetical protein
MEHYVSGSFDLPFQVGQYVIDGKPAHNALTFPVPDEIPDRTVITPFSGGGEEAPRDFAVFAVVDDTGATAAPLVTGGIRAGAMFLASFSDTFHRSASLPAFLPSCLTDIIGNGKTEVNGKKSEVRE